jgi:hypothetical protein
MAPRSQRLDLDHLPTQNKVLPQAVKTTAS